MFSVHSRVGENLQKFTVDERMRNETYYYGLAVACEGGGGGVAGWEDRKELVAMSAPAWTAPLLSSPLPAATQHQSVTTIKFTISDCSHQSQPIFTILMIASHISGFVF